MGLAFFILVQSKNLFPQLLLARIFFSLGGAATTTMVTAILPLMARPEQSQYLKVSDDNEQRPASASASSELTVTPERLRGNGRVTKGSPKWLRGNISSTRLAGFVGAFAGCGALVALGCFLPLPALFQKQNISPGRALTYTYYLVGCIAILVAFSCFLGLHRLKGEEGKSWAAVFGPTAITENASAPKAPNPAFYRRFVISVKLGFESRLIGLGYLGGFVARASSVGISLFIPLYVNNYFISSGLCDVDDDQNIKIQCREAYVLAAKLTGTSQLVALISAPIFGFAGKESRANHTPLAVASLCGILGYLSFALLNTPDPGRAGGTYFVFLAASLLGISQIGAIVCSLGSLSCGIAASRYDKQPDPEPDPESSARPGESCGETDVTCTEDSTPSSDESQHLLDTHGHDRHQDLDHLRGTVAGTYSFVGGAGILLLTKLGGLLFDTATPAAPFVMMAAFNALLLLAVIICSMQGAIRSWRKPSVRG